MNSHRIDVPADSQHVDSASPLNGIHAEFDEYATDYDAGMSHPLKRFAGQTADDYLEPKVTWLLKHLMNSCNADSSPVGARLLDVGCGSGSFLRCLRTHGFSGSMSGCDISSAMLAEAARTWKGAGAPSLDLITDGRLPYSDASFDVVIACAVLHHVAPPDRMSLFNEISRVLASTGKLFVFEHNPWNPLTQIVVRSTEIDRNAILLSARETCLRAVEARFEVLTTNYLLFFPPRWKWLKSLEMCLRWIPFGAQYVVTAQAAHCN